MRLLPILKLKILHDICRVFWWRSYIGWCDASRAALQQDVIEEFSVNWESIRCSNSITGGRVGEWSTGSYDSLTNSLLKIILWLSFPLANEIIADVKDVSKSEGCRSIYECNQRYYLQAVNQHTPRKLLAVSRRTRQPAGQLAAVVGLSGVHEDVHQTGRIGTARLSGSGSRGAGLVACRRYLHSFDSSAAGDSAQHFKLAENLCDDEDCIRGRRTMERSSLIATDGHLRCWPDSAQAYRTLKGAAMINFTAFLSVERSSIRCQHWSTILALSAKKEPSVSLRKIIYFNEFLDRYRAVLFWLH